MYELYEEVWHGAADGMSVTGEFPDPVEAGSTRVAGNMSTAETFQNNFGGCGTRRCRSGNDRSRRS